MSTRDRTVLMVVAVLAVVGAGWVLLVSPKRDEANKVAAQVATAHEKLSAAQGKLAQAQQAQSQYAAAYSAMVNLGKAVPASQEVPALIVQIAHASSAKSVDFASIANEAGKSNGAASSASASGASSATGTAEAAAFTQMPFTFVFDGSYFELEHLLGQLNQFTSRTTAGTLSVRGRLLTVQSLKLAPVSVSGAGATSTSSTQLMGTITATAYVLPASQGLTGGASAASPSAATPASSSTGASSATAPAIARVTP